MQIDGSLNTARLAQVPERVAQLRDLGYDGGYAFEGPGDVFTTCTLAAQAMSGSMALSTQVAVAFARNPLSLAYLANDLQELSGGHFTLGLGSQARQNIEQRFSMSWGKPVTRMRDMIEALRAIFRCWLEGERLQHEGPYYTHTRMQPMFTPPPCVHGAPDIMLGAIGRPMTELAGELADAFVVIPFHTPAFLEQVTFPALEAGARRAGRHRSALRLHAQCMVVTGCDADTMEEARQRTRNQIAFYGSTPIYAPALQAAGWGDFHPRWRRMVQEGRWQELAGTVSDAQLEAFAVCGEPESVAHQLHARFGAWCDRLSVMTCYVMQAEAEERLLSELRRLRED